MASRKKGWNANASPGGSSPKKNVVVAKGRGAGLSDREADTSVTLKNGARVPVGEALASYDMLTTMLDNEETEHLKAIRSLASGRSPEVPKNILKDLRDAGFLTPDGDLKPSTRDIFVSSYRPASDGDVMVWPFAAAGSQEQELLASREALYEGRLNKLARRLKRDDSGPSL